MLSTIAACGTIKKEIGLRRDSGVFLIQSFFDTSDSCGVDKGGVIGKLQYWGKILYIAKTIYALHIDNKVVSQRVLKLSFCREDLCFITLLL